MGQTALQLLANPVVRAAMQPAWLDSNPAPTGRHEEGGFILRDSASNIAVSRWPKGIRDFIVVPSHEDCRLGDCDIIASFHTHPNTGYDFDQEPSETDQVMIASDPDLKGSFDVGELIISAATVYLVEPDGTASELAATKVLFAEPRGE